MEGNINPISAANSPVAASSGHSVAFWLLLAGLIFVLTYYYGLIRLGFTATGVVKGSIAALWQSSIAIGNGVGVVAGSLFSILQSVTMGGIAMSPIILRFLAIWLAVVVAIELRLPLFEWLMDFRQWFQENVNVAQRWKELSQWFHENVNFAQIWNELSHRFHENVNFAHIWNELSHWFHDQVRLGKWWAGCVQWMKRGV